MSYNDGAMIMRKLKQREEIRNLSRMVRGGLRKCDIWIKSEGSKG